MRVRSGDRLGLFFKEGPGAVSYSFKTYSPPALSFNSKNNTDGFRVGDVVNFDNLGYPYDFSVAAYIYRSSVGNSSSDDDDLVPCPRGLLIPPEAVYTLSTTTPTLITGKPGATGPQGATGATGISGPDGVVGMRGPTGEQGATGVVGPDGYNGRDGLAGLTGYIGMQGLQGGTGATGAKGPDGMMGPAGPPGPIGVIPTGVPVRSAKDILKHSIIWVLLIWLIIVTVASLILLIVLCIMLCHHESDEDDDLEKATVDNTDQHEEIPPQLTIDVDSWLDTMKDQSVTSMDPVYINTKHKDEKYTDFADPDSRNRNSIYAPFAESSINIEEHRSNFSYEPATDQSDKDSGISAEGSK